MPPESRGGSIMAEEKNQNEIALYIAADGSMQLDVRIAAETVWLTQRQMAELFDTSIDNISLHLKNIYDCEELAEAATVEDYSVVQQEGRRSVRRLRHYDPNLAGLDLPRRGIYRERPNCGRCH